MLLGLGIGLWVGLWVGGGCWSAWRCGKPAAGGVGVGNDVGIVEHVELAAAFADDVLDVAPGTGLGEDDAGEDLLWPAFSASL